MAGITKIAGKRRVPKQAASVAELAAAVEESLGEQTIAALYRDCVCPLRTRRYELKATAPGQTVEVMHTLLGVELKIGRRRLLCPDLATARYLAVFARLGVAEVAVPYDITQLARIADELETAWFRLLTLSEHLTAERSAHLRGRVRARLIAAQRELITQLGGGAAVPQFNQNTKQRRP